MHPSFTGLTKLTTERPYSVLPGMRQRSGMTPDEEDGTCRRADTGATTRRYPRIRRAVSESTGAGLGGKLGGEMGNVVIDMSMSLDGYIAAPNDNPEQWAARTA
jgi:hypothetical protein